MYSTKIYTTHDNHTRPFKVSVKVLNFKYVHLLYAKTILISDDILKMVINRLHRYKVDILRLKKESVDDNMIIWDEDLEYYENSEDSFELFKKDLIPVDVILPTYVKKDNIDGVVNSMLLEFVDNKYIYIGSNIFTFDSEFEIIYYNSDTGNNDVPYPYALDKCDNCYFMSDRSCNGSYLIDVLKPRFEFFDYNYVNDMFLIYCDKDTKFVYDLANYHNEINKMNEIVYSNNTNDWDILDDIDNVGFEIDYSKCFEVLDCLVKNGDWSLDTFMDTVKEVDKINDVSIMDDMYGKYYGHTKDPGLCKYNIKMLFGNYRENINFYNDNYRKGTILKFEVGLFNKLPYVYLNNKIVKFFKDRAFFKKCSVKIDIIHERNNPFIN